MVFVSWRVGDRGIGGPAFLQPTTQDGDDVLPAAGVVVGGQGKGVFNPRRWEFFLRRQQLLADVVIEGADVLFVQGVYVTAPTNWSQGWLEMRRSGPGPTRGDVLRRQTLQTRIGHVAPGVRVVEENPHLGYLADRQKCAASQIGRQRAA